MSRVVLAADSSRGRRTPQTKLEDAVELVLGRGAALEIRKERHGVVALIWRRDGSEVTELRTCRFTKLEAIRCAHARLLHFAEALR